MKRLLIGAFLSIIAFAQTPSENAEDKFAVFRIALTELQTSYNSLNAVNQSLQSQLAWVIQLNQICPTCKDAITSGLSGKNGVFQAVVICCGPSTVPATPTNTVIIYISKEQ